MLAGQLRTELGVSGRWTGFHLSSTLQGRGAQLAMFLRARNHLPSTTETKKQGTKCVQVLKGGSFNTHFILLDTINVEGQKKLDFWDV